METTITESELVALRNQAPIIVIGKYTLVHAPDGWNDRIIWAYSKDHVYTLLSGGATVNSGELGYLTDCMLRSEYRTPCAKGTKGGEVDLKKALRLAGISERKSGHGAGRYSVQYFQCGTLIKEYDL